MWPLPWVIVWLLLMRSFKRQPIIQKGTYWRTHDKFMDRFIETCKKPRLVFRLDGIRWKSQHLNKYARKLRKLRRRQSQHFY